MLTSAERIQGNAICDVMCWKHMVEENLRNMTIAALLFIRGDSQGSEVGHR